MSYQTDQQRRDDQKNKIIKEKNAVLKHYQDALEKTIADNMLESAAIVFVAPFGPSEIAPVFSTEEEGRTMLVTENPGYLRKDLAKDVPQFIIINWQWNDSKPDKNLRKLFEENFEVEKLQAMIDK